MDIYIETKWSNAVDIFLMLIWCLGWSAFNMCIQIKDYSNKDILFNQKNQNKIMFPCGIKT